MPRKGIVSRRAQATDPVYGETIVEKFICSMMWEGKKSTAQRVFYGAMDQVAKKTSDDALKVFKKALENVGLPYSVDPGEGVFYGPKIDLKIKDSLGRQISASNSAFHRGRPAGVGPVAGQEKSIDRRALVSR